MTSAWSELPRAADDATWDRFYAEFDFRPSMTVVPGIREPHHSVTFDISGVYGEEDRYRQLTLDLSEKLVAALRRCVPEGEVVHALDWQHSSYRFEPHRPFEFASEDDWPVPALPNGDYFLFLDPALRFGVFGHPWEQSMCVFGDALIDAFRADPPRLFERLMRVGGKPPKTVYLLIGPKGCGKTTLGGMLEASLGLPFLRVEPLLMAHVAVAAATSEGLEHDGYDIEEAALDELLGEHDEVLTDATGSSPHLARFLRRLRSRYAVKLIRVRCPLDECLRRVRARDDAEQFDVPEERVRMINAASERLELDWDLELDNAGPLSTDTLCEQFGTLREPPERDAS
jgi:shikimate kinase